MRVRLTIDRVVLDGLDLSPRERAGLLEELHASLRKEVMAEAAGGNPFARHAVRERADLTGTMRSGAALAKAVAGQVWTGNGHQNGWTR